jgi:hypothetical protein
MLVAPELLYHLSFWEDGLVLIVVSALFFYMRRRLVRKWLLPIFVLASMMTIGLAIIAVAIVANDPSRFFGEPCTIYLVTERDGQITGARYFLYGRSDYRFADGARITLVAAPKCRLRGDMIVNDTTKHLRVERVYYGYASVDETKIVERFDPFTAIFMGGPVSWFGQVAPLTWARRGVHYWLTWD